MADRMQFRRDTAANWTAYNPILLEGELGFELNTDQYKLGDGVHNWNALPYRGLPCVQQRGTSVTTSMSQKAVTEELENIGIFDISDYNNNAHYANLSDALAVVPQSYQKGGMTIKFILQEGDEPANTDKYVQYRLMSATWNTTVSNWQGIDDEPIAGSANIITSDGASKPQIEFNLSNLTIRSQPSGYKISNSGNLVADANFKLIKYNVTEGSLLRLKLSKDGDGVYQFQNSDSIPLSGTNPYIVGRTITNAADGIVRVPTGATLLFVAQLISNTTNVAKVCNNSIDAEPTKDSKNLISSDAVYNITHKIIENEGLYKVGRYLTSNGSDHTDDDLLIHYAVSHFIPVIAGRIYEVRVARGDTVKAGYLYDDNKKPIAELFSNKSGYFVETLSIDSVLQSYPNAKYFRISGVASGDNSIYIKGLSVSECIVIANEIIKDIEGYSDLFRWNKYGIAHNGRLNTNIYSIHTDYIPLIAGAIYDAALYYGPTNVAALYCYDKYLAPMGEFIFDGAFAGFYTQIVVDDILEEYPNAKFFRASGYLTNDDDSNSSNAVKSFIRKIGLSEIFNLIFLTRDIVGEVEGQKSIFAYPGQVVNHQGTIVENANFIRTIPIPIIRGREYIATGYYDPSACAFCYLYDKDMNPLEEYITGVSGAQDSIISTDTLLAQNSNAAFFIISVQSSSQTDYAVKGLSISDALHKISEIIPELNDNTERLSNVESTIGDYTSIHTYTQDDFSGIAYNTNTNVFIGAGPTTNSVIVPIESGRDYLCNYSVRLCTEIPDVGKTDSIISRIIAANTRFTCSADEKYIFLAASVSSFVSANIIFFGFGLGTDVETLQGDVAELDTRIDALEEDAIPSELLKKAAEYDAVNLYRERQLRQEYQNKVANDNYVGKWYGVEWTEVDNPDNVTAINSTGDSNLHTTLPIQNKMRRCITKDNIVQYYLDVNNSELKADGVTAADLTGGDGNVMVEIPEFFYKIEEETENNVRTIRIKISEDALPDFIFSPKRYTSAYEATINRTSGFLASVCTTNFTRQASEAVGTVSSSSYIQGTGYTRTEKTARRNGHTANAATYRGGTNDATLDQYENPSETNYARNQLGIPVANINRMDIRNVCDEYQFGYLYDTQRILYMLIQVEYKTRNIQKTIADGGLGKGATVYPSYEAYESFFKPQRGISCIPCGVTNSLGNHSGEVYFLMENVPISQTGSGDNITYTFGNVWMPCMSYRGIEHYYGHIYKIADQVDCVTGPTTGYVEGHENEIYWSKHDVSYWYEKNPYLAKAQIKKNANLLGTWNFPCHIMAVSSLLMGKYGHVLHINAKDKDYTKNYCDCCEIDSLSGQTKFITFNGRIVSNTLVGNHFLVSFNTVDGGDARPSDGTRLDHF